MAPCADQEWKTCARSSANVFLQRAAGAVENHIEASKPRDRRFNGAAHCLILRHVGLDEKRVSARRANLVLGSFAQFRVKR